MADDKALKDAIKKEIEAGNNLTLSWDCGGDEAIIEVFMNDKNIDATRMADQLSVYILNFLDLPDAGEFSMVGKGKIYEEGGDLFLDCETILKGYEDEDGWITMNEPQKHFSGKKLLFADN